MTSLVENKPKGLSLRKEPEIQELIKGLEKGTHQSSVNLPFWNANAMIHRRGGIDQDSYYMSLKMISRRTRGAEGFSPDNNSYHMGDGFFQVKTSGTEYFDVRYDWDWHVLPGTTSEWKTDALPPAKSTYEYPTGRNTYAGVVSNGYCGAASFVYDRSEDPYSSVVAKKSYFMFDEVAVLVGSGIRRVHPGQGNDIVTTIDQASWTTDITFKIGAANEKIVKLGSDVDLNLDTDELSWVHQGNTGYIIWPNQQKKFSHIILKTGSIINDTDTGRSGDAKVFHLALNHGVDPNPSKSVYSYAVVPNVTAGEMAEISNRLNRQLTIRINNRSHHSVQHSGQTMTQVAFFMPSTVEAGENLSISVDAAAMVLLREGSNQIEAVLSDPDFSVTESVINLTVSRKLKSGSYAYRTMGVKNQQAETVEVNDVDAGTRLSFNLPDPSDSKLYHNRQEVYYGMPAAVTIPRQDTPPPNVLMIAVDDLNDWISPLGGHPQSITPNFDRLANQGTRFMNAHCQAPLCGPSRASLFTGLNPSSTGIYLHVKDEEIKLANEVADSATLLTHYFQQHGYKTMGAGKLLHDGAGADLLEDYAGHKDFGPRPEKKFKYDSEGTSTDWGPYPTSQEEMPDYHVASYAIKKLSESHDKPFFLAVGFNRPHVPWYVPQKWFERIDLDSVITPPYLKDDLDDAPEISRIIHNMEPTPKTEWLIEKGYWKEMVRAYLACVSFVDDQLGRVLDALAHSAYADNTIIVLWSDHGYHLGEKNIVAKMTLYEESTRVPLIFAGPGVPADAYCGRPVGLIDIYPTLLELADLPANKNVEGHSLVPLLKNPLSEWEHPALTFWGLNNTAVRTERYRYIQYEDGSEELYDRSIDPNEWQNLAGNPETKTLRESLRSFVPENQAELSSLCWFPWNAYWIQKTKEAKERISK
jgi:arylsulfatase A-like enzyme